MRPRPELRISHRRSITPLFRGTLGLRFWPCSPALPFSVPGGSATPQKAGALGHPTGEQWPEMGWESDQTLGSLLLGITVMPFPCLYGTLDHILSAASNVGSLQRKGAEISGREPSVFKDACRYLASPSKTLETSAVEKSKSRSRNRDTS